MSRGRHRPQRTCLGCGGRDDQERLIRVVAEAGGKLRMLRRSGGRGGYLHRRRECWAAFVRRKSVFRAFRVEVSREARERLVRDLSEGHWELPDGKNESPSFG